MNDVAAWQECVDNSNAQLEHQALRFVMHGYMLVCVLVLDWDTAVGELARMLQCPVRFSVLVLCYLSPLCTKSYCLCLHIAYYSYLLFAYFFHRGPEGLI